MEPSIRPLSPPKAGYPTSIGPKMITNAGRSPTAATPKGNLSPRTLNARSNHKKRKSCKDFLFRPIRAAHLFTLSYQRDGDWVEVPSTRKNLVSSRVGSSWFVGAL